MEADIRKLATTRGADSDDELGGAKKKQKKSVLEEELKKYEKGRGLRTKGKGKGKDESDVMAILNSFRGKLKSGGKPGDEGGMEGDAQETTGDGMEVDDDTGFMNHVLQFPKDDGEESMKAERDYEVIDPRVRGARAKEEERERKRQQKAQAGRRR
jgi:peptidyl-prolyl cis-trans isomerase SDCCAG10